MLMLSTASSSRCKRPPVGVRGFTLIELIIAMVVIAILAAIAIPNYQDYILRSRRADAQAFLLEVAARQQHFLVDRRAYSTSITAAANAGGLAMTVPARVGDYYTIDFNDGVNPSTVNNAATPPTFTVFAVPRGPQTGDRCGTLGLTQAGVRSATGAATGCWERTGS
jgi:type IV pilus assembly protein PilE